MRGKCLNCEKMDHHIRDFSEPKELLSDIFSDFCVASRILLSKTNPMWIVCLGIQMKEQVSMKLQQASNGLLHGSMRTHLEITTMWLSEELEYASWSYIVVDTPSDVKSYLRLRFVGIILLCWFHLNMFMALKHSQNTFSFGFTLSEMVYLQWI